MGFKNVGTGQMLQRREGERSVSQTKETEEVQVAIWLDFPPKEKVV